ncbi:hypothetical protein M5K25_003389 [Dendrobium thyrsiflorum]|uniref:Uncharacterized protein n=1 Tax=Dendrobium thyrsiflorum TaxID=117978 RepID=A0ABD0VJ34_DENTH
MHLEDRDEAFLRDHVRQARHWTPVSKLPLPHPSFVSPSRSPSFAKHPTPTLSLPGVQSVQIRSRSPYLHLRFARPRRQKPDPPSLYFSCSEPHRLTELMRMHNDFGKNIEQGGEALTKKCSFFLFHPYTVMAENPSSFLRQRTATLPFSPLLGDGREPSSFLRQRTATLPFSPLLGDGREPSSFLRQRTATIFLLPAENRNFLFHHTPMKAENLGKH